MKKIFTIGIIYSLFFVVHSFSINNFTFSPSAVVSMTASCGYTYSSAHVDINNSKGDTLGIYYEVIENTLNQDTGCWELQFCDNLNCFSSVPTGVQYLFRLDTGLNAYVFKLEVKPKNVLGSGIVKIRVVEAANSLNADTLTFNVLACPTGVFCATGIADDNFLAETSIYPNPAKDVLYVSFGNPGPGIDIYIEIVDLPGNKIYSTQVSNEQNIQINISDFLPGIYFVKLKSANGPTFLRRIIIS